MKKTIIILLSLILLSGCLSSCVNIVENEKDVKNESVSLKEKADKDTSDPKESASSKEAENDENENDSAQEDASEEPKAEDSSVSEDEVPSSNDILNGFKSEKIGSIDKDDFDLYYDSFREAGLVYRKDGKYGVLSLDATKDTGAKYVSVKEITSSHSEYLTVSEKETDLNDIDSVNSKGILDSSLNEIIPMEYASFNYLSERYIMAIKATERTENSNEALLYYESGLPLSLGPSENAVYFKGIWYIFDTVSGNFIEGVQGTDSNKMPSSYGSEVKGDFIKYKNDNDEFVTINHKGESLPAGATLLDNGYYTRAEENEEGLIVNVVCDSEGKKLFEYSADSYIPISADGDYIIGRKSVNGSYSYVYMDNTGKVVSVEYSSRPTLIGDYVFYNNELFDMSGNNIVEGKYDSVKLEKTFKQTLLLKKDSDYTIIDTKGNVIWQGNDDDESLGGYQSSEYNMYKKKEDGYYYYYSLKDDDYTIRSSEKTVSRPWIIEIKNLDNEKEVVDMISGATLVSDYWDYHIIDASDKNRYIYAYDTNYNTDIYKITAK